MIIILNILKFYSIVARTWSSYQFWRCLKLIFATLNIMLIDSGIQNNLFLFGQLIDLSGWINFFFINFIIGKIGQTYLSFLIVYEDIIYNAPSWNAYSLIGLIEILCHIDIRPDSNTRLHLFLTIMRLNIKLLVLCQEDDIFVLKVKF